MKRGDNETPMKRCTVYCRVSTSGQEEDGTSLDTQESRSRTYAEAHGYVLVGIFTDVQSGAKFRERPGLSALRERVRAGAVDVVLAYAVDRLSRNQAHLAILAEEVAEHGARLEFVTEDFEDSAVGRFILAAKAFAAEIEREKIIERSMRGRLARVQSGKIHNAASELYGYHRDKTAGVRHIYEPEAVVVRRIFQWVATEGKAVRGIARALNDELVPSPAMGKRTFSPTSGKSPRWNHSSIYRILSEPAYKGEQYAWRRRRSKETGHKEELRDPSEWVRLPDGTTPAIVSPAIWEAAQRRLAANTGEATRNQTRPYLLRGIIHCDACGRRMYSTPERNGFAYRCGSRDSAAGFCGGKRVPAERIEEWVWSQVTRILSDPSLIAAEVERQRSAGPDSSIVAERETTARLVTKLDKQQERLVRKFAEADADSDFPWELVEQEIGRTEQERKAARALLAEIDATLVAQEAAVVQLEALHGYCDRVQANLATLDFAHKRYAVEALVERVVANGSDSAGWTLHGSIPATADADVVAVSTTSARCERRRPRSPTRV